MLFNQIIGSHEYTLLRERKAWRSIYERYYARSIIAGYDTPRLEMIQKAVKILPDLLSELIYSIGYGCGPKLTPADKPDFYDLPQLEALKGKIEGDSKGKNFSNISASEFLLLFEDNVIKSAEDVLMMLPAGAEYKSADDISKALPNIKFCIRSDDFFILKSKFDESLFLHEKDIGKQKVIKLGRWLMKIALILILLAVPLVLNMLGFLSSELLGISTGVVGVASLVYLILG